MKKRGLCMAVGGMLYGGPTGDTRRVDSTGTREGEAGFGQNGAKVPIDPSSLIRKLDGSDGPMKRTQRQFYGQQLGLLAAQGMVDGADMERRMNGSNLTATARRGFGHAANQSLEFGSRTTPSPVAQPSAPAGGSFSMANPATPAPTASLGFAGMREGERKMLGQFDERMGNSPAATPAITTPTAPAVSALTQPKPLAPVTGGMPSASHSSTGQLQLSDTPQPPKLGLAAGGLLDPKRPSTGGPIVTGGIRGNNDFAEGGIVRGKGGPTDDEVPMQVAGKDVNLSNSEAVLPAKTVQALGGPEAVEGLIEQTNGKPPVKGGLREGGAYYGGVVDDFGDRIKAQGKMPPVTVNDSVTGEVVKPNVRPTIVGQQDFRANAPQPTPSATAAPGYTPRNPNANPNVGAGRPSPEALKYAEAQAAAQAGPQAAPRPLSPGEVSRKGMASPEISLKGAAESVSDAAKWVADSRVGRGVAYVSKKAAKSLPYIGGAIDAAGVVDVATDEKMSKLDVATEVARNAGRWGSAAVGAKTFGAGGAALGTAVLPGLGTAVGGGIGALVGGVGGYLGADKVMDLGSGTTSPSTRSNGVVTQTKDKVLGKETPATAEEKAQEAAWAAYEKQKAELQWKYNAIRNDPTGGLRQKGTPVPDQAGLNKVMLENNADVRGLRAAGVTGDVAPGSEYGKIGATGIREISPANGQKIYAGRDAKGQLHINSTGGLTPGQADAARDKQFAEAGYGKDAYGNWMTPQRLGDKAALAQLQRERAFNDATDPSITDPDVREMGMRKLQMFNARDTADAAEKKGLREDRRLDLRERHEMNIADRQTAALEASARTEGRKAMTERGKGVREAITAMFKDDPAKIEAAMRYSSQIKRADGEDDNDYVSRVLTQLNAESKLGDAQQHWLKFGDTEFKGEAQQYRKYEPTLFERFRMGLRGGDVYQSVHDKDNILSLPQAQLTPQELQFFKQHRVVNN